MIDSDCSARPICVDVGSPVMYRDIDVGHGDGGIIGHVDGGIEACKFDKCW